MKKYLLFAYYEYYPAGGLNDLHSAYDNKDEADAVAEVLVESGEYDYVYVQSLDDIENIIKSHSWIKEEE